MQHILSRQNSSEWRYFIWWVSTDITLKFRCTPNGVVICNQDLEPSTSRHF